VGGGAGWLNIVHIHADPDQVGGRIHFDLFRDYPVPVLSWSDALTGPTLHDAMALTTRCLMGGMAERGPLTHGGRAELEAEMRSAISQAGGRRLILANGCSVPDDTPEMWLRTARDLVDEMGAIMTR
jgi:uroporphyrinogen decarboxylase